MTFIKCLQCGQILESKTVHDFNYCQCENQTFVDGGDEYCRYGGMDMDKIQMIDSTTVDSMLREHYPTYDPDVDDRPIGEILWEIDKKLRKYT